MKNTSCVLYLSSNWLHTTHLQSCRLQFVTMGFVFLRVPLSGECTAGVPYAQPRIYVYGRLKKLQIRRPCPRTQTGRLYMKCRPIDSSIVIGCLTTCRCRSRHKELGMVHLPGCWYLTEIMQTWWARQDGSMNNTEAFYWLRCTHSA